MDNLETHRTIKYALDTQKKEKQGMLFELPCKVGATVYVLAKCGEISEVLDGNYETATGYYCPYELSGKCPHKEYEECDDMKDVVTVFEDVVTGFVIDDMYGVTVMTENTINGPIGENIFLEKEAAEKTLTERNGELWRD